ncbi:GntR family transcriptional regulator [Bordetella sp. 15P40C-2]|uniref:GntR family transcriptional regulator n=1 Tax=Bordetella sp. 15P40C-2 TaxID=2572246 RepID=UPI0013250A2D|nr:GntR family transcriptional regulator [Bordetella sp. 15P40C-2]MVW70421.1 GntR family transcriptional regulator [Bordetella sp. 15P40C-2]
MALHTSAPPSGRARYLIVTDTLAREIGAGTFPVGTLLPREAELIERFQVSRTTIREALKRLSSMGLVSTLHGVGTRVEAREVHASYLVAMRSIKDVLQYEGERTRFQVEDRRDLIARDSDRELLRCAAGQKWKLIKGCNLSSAGPYKVFADTIIHIRAPYDDILTRKSRYDVPFYSLIRERHGLEIVRIEQELEAIELDERQAEVLEVAVGSPGLRIVRRYYCEENEPFEVTINVHPSKRFTYKMNLDRKAT